MTATLSLVPGLAFVENVGRFVVGVLAVAGGAFFGGLLVGLLTQVLAKLLTAKSVPRPALTFVRLLGAVVGGVLVAMVLFQSGGGGGWGLGGWSSLGPGQGNGGEQPNPVPNGKEPSPPPDKPPLPRNGEPAPKTGALRIEVLGDEPQPQRRFYRIEGESRLYTLDEVAEILSRRRKEDPDLKKAIIVLYQNSPDRDTAVVRDLMRLIETRGLTPDISFAPGRAPQ
ncbi:MAG TPA: hypothetical protein VNK04_07990 [Gemmataceae bacterium]|nr:hypothetical protein [Gemmataceae bacterium]